MNHTSVNRIIGYAGLILGLGYLFFFLSRVDISLIYYWQQAIPWPFGHYLQEAGGISNLIGVMFANLFDNKLLGSISVLVLFGFIFFLLYRIFREPEKNPLLTPVLLTSFIPLVSLFAHYRAPLGLLLSIVAGVVFGFIYSLVSPGKTAGKIISVTLLGIIAYLLAGFSGLAVFMQIVIARALMSRRFVELLYIIPVLAVIPLLYMLFNNAYTLELAYLNSFRVIKYDEVPMVFYIGMFSPGIIAILLSLLRPLVQKIKESGAIILKSGLTILVLFGLVLTSLSEINENEQTTIRIEQASIADDWQRVLELSTPDLATNKLVQFEVNRALYSKGLLLEQLFYLPQYFGEESIFMDHDFSGKFVYHASDFYYDLGFANETRHWANESHTVMMRHPIVLKQLILSYVAIDKPGVAVKYINVLSKSGKYKEWCDQTRNAIESGEILNDSMIVALRANSPETDFFTSSSNSMEKLKYFYLSNTDNQMAFEFLMAGYLLKHQMVPILNSLADLRRLGYDKIPRNIEEAIIIFLARNQSVSIELHGYKFSKSTIDEFKDYTRLLASGASPEESMINLEKYNHTYWYYIMYTSPYAQKK